MDYTHKPDITLDLTPAALRVLEAGDALDVVHLALEGWVEPNTPGKKWSKPEPDEYAVMEAAFTELGYRITTHFTDPRFAHREQYLNNHYRHFQPESRLGQMTSVYFPGFLNEFIRENKGSFPDALYYANEMLTAHHSDAVGPMLRQSMFRLSWLRQHLENRSANRLDELTEALAPDAIIEHTDPDGYGYMLTVPGALSSVKDKFLAHCPEYSMFFVEVGGFLPLDGEWVLLNQDGEVSCTQSNDIAYDKPEVVAKLHEFQAKVVNHFRLRKLNLLIE